MEDGEIRIEQTIREGERNKVVVALVHNWCRHAEINRHGGVGLIEQHYNVPIGLMGLRCKHVGGSTMFCGRLEDAAYNFYLEHCKTCKKRQPVGFPNITSFTAPREAEADRRERETEAEKRQIELERNNRHQVRATLKSELGISAAQILDLIDDLDQPNAASNDKRLEELARLAPENFSSEVIKYLHEAAFGCYTSYRDNTAKALLILGQEKPQQIQLAVQLLKGYCLDELPMSVVLDNVSELTELQVRQLTPNFVNMALPSPPSIMMGDHSRHLDSRPIQVLFEKKPDDLTKLVKELIHDLNPDRIEEGLRALLAIDSAELYLTHLRTIIGKLLRRRTILPNTSSRSDLVHYLRDTCTKAFRLHPKAADGVINSLLLDNDATVKQEASEIYARSMQRHFDAAVHRELFHEVAFPRLINLALSDPSAGFENSASQFFIHAKNEYSWLAAKYMDLLIGSAATLSQQMLLVDTPSTIIQPKNGLEELEKSNQRAAIDSLQGAMIAWAAIGASERGPNGVADFVQLYEKLPEGQVQMRANTIAHFGNLMSNTEKMQCVLSALYRALMDSDPQIRASAAQAIGDTSYRITQHFPNLVFEAYAALLTDPIKWVHKSALRHMRSLSFPEELRPQVRSALVKLILAYANERPDGSFLVDCVDVFARSYCTKDELKGRTGIALCEILEKLEDAGLYDAVDQLFTRFTNVPGYVRVVLKALRSHFTRRISTQDCMTVLLNTSSEELSKCRLEINSTLNEYLPASPITMRESTILITLLTKAGFWDDAHNSAKHFLESIPDDERNRKFRLEFKLLYLAITTERDLTTQVQSDSTLTDWVQTERELEDEGGGRNKPKGIPKLFLR
jgi:hypothetical protein